MSGPYSQDTAQLRMEWGVHGALETSSEADFAVVVDILSFTTTLSVAVDTGVEVFPYPWNDESAAGYARERAAMLAIGRTQAHSRYGHSAVTLSPRTIRTSEGLSRLVLPSPNGSALCTQLLDAGVTVIGACLRNRTAVARWLATRLTRDSDAVVTIIAAGERWPDGSLRPAVEDLWGAGALVAALNDFGYTNTSPEATTSAAGFLAVQRRLAGVLRQCSSGRELDDSGFGDDIDIAAELDGSTCVPTLIDGRFVDDTR